MASTTNNHQAQHSPAAITIDWHSDSFKVYVDDSNRDAIYQRPAVFVEFTSYRDQGAEVFTNFVKLPTSVVRVMASQADEADRNYTEAKRKRN